MSIFPRIIVDKHCFVACPPERCNCKAGNRMAWVAQQAQFGLDADGKPLKEAADLKAGIGWNLPPAK